jgi:ribosome maturation factor RimP
VGASPLFSLRRFWNSSTVQQLTGFMGFELDRVREIVERVAATSGLEVVEVELRGGGKARMLRIVIDKVHGTAASSRDPVGGVTHEDCATLSREVGTILDVEDMIPGNSYLLEVSSPGLDRKLLLPADYERFTGSRVKLKTRNPVNGTQHFEGRLQSFCQGRLTLEVSESRKKARPGDGTPRTLEIELANVERANLVPEI